MTAPDGSPVDLYLLSPPAGEAERLHAAIAGGVAVLDLGCGVGRIAHELIRLGHPVVAGHVGRGAPPLGRIVAA
jgi:predicted RNA methylase